ncbi:hypothetical protein CEXT_812131 [Caerostris extrusa]|uniref:Uncharacterized protein n=1 Tax=Caerostris extrusa TaxID=172846 RepID=A0AAV4TG10_CAEEX|nr:hypothetical protein CEXT_812131 [Caerostris extrusa]
MPPLHPTPRDGQESDPDLECCVSSAVTVMDGVRHTPARVHPVPHRPSFLRSPSIVLPVLSWSCMDILCVVKHENEKNSISEDILLLYEEKYRQGIFKGTTSTIQLKTPEDPYLNNHRLTSSRACPSRQVHRQSRFGNPPDLKTAEPVIYRFHNAQIFRFASYS